LAQNKTILVVDDEIQIRRVIELKLKINGFRVISAGDGKAGLDLIHAQAPDAVITDINMPVMDGKTMCVLSNAIKRNRRFLTVVITARISPTEQEWISEMTDTVFMEKPFSPAKLIDAITHYFEGGNQ